MGGPDGRGRDLTPLLKDSQVKNYSLKFRYMVEELLGLIGVGAFGMFFITMMLIGLIDVLGKFYGTYHSLIRDDLSGEQRIIYLALIWFIPIGWGIYFLLGKEKTADLFSEVDFL